MWQGAVNFAKKNTSTRKPGPSLNNEAIESTRLLKMMCLILKFVWEPQGNSWPWYFEDLWGPPSGRGDFANQTSPWGNGVPLSISKSVFTFAGTLTWSRGSWNHCTPPHFRRSSVAFNNVTNRLFPTIAYKWRCSFKTWLHFTQIQTSSSRKDSEIHI